METTIASEAKPLPPVRRGLKILIRVLCLVALATLIGWTLNRSVGALERDGRAAGFTRGVVHGALMPLALPNLLVGNDVTIYAANNTGRTYKLGYTLGVNVCGALFFGFFFWRVRRWRKREGLRG